MLALAVKAAVICFAATPLADGGYAHGVGNQANCVLDGLLKNTIMKFFKDLRRSIAEGLPFHGHYLGGPRIVYDLKWDCNLEKQAREYKLAEETNPSHVMKKYPTWGWTVAINDLIGNATADDIFEMLGYMLGSEREKLLLAYPFISRVGCSTFARQYTEKATMLKIGCVYDSNPPKSFQITSLTGKDKGTYCKSDADCTHISGSKCHDKLCIAPQHIYVRGRFD